MWRSLRNTLDIRGRKLYKFTICGAVHAVWGDNIGLGGSGSRFSSQTAQKKYKEEYDSRIMVSRITHTF